MPEKPTNGGALAPPTEPARDRGGRPPPAGDASQPTEQQWRSIFDHSLDPIFFLDRQGRFTDANPAAQRLSGYSWPELRQMSFAQLCAPDQLLRAQENFRQELRGISVDLATAIITKTGRRAELYITGGPVYVAGAVAGVFGIARDVTEQKRANAALRQSNELLESTVAERRQMEQALREARDQLEKRVQERTVELEAALRALRASEQQLRLLAENASDVIWTTDPAGRFTYASPSIEWLLGYTPAEAVRHTITQVSTPASKAVALQKFAEVQAQLRAGQRVGSGSLVLEHFRKDGSTVWVEVSISGMYSPAGEFLGIVGVTRDISERRELEQAVLEISNREQRRIGQDLHDSLCQQLVGTTLLVKTLQDDLAKQSSPLAAAAAEINRLVQDALTEARGLAYGLCPTELEAHDLVAALRHLAAATESLFRVSCTVAHDGPVVIPDQNVALHLYRITQEAISNAIRHGQAKQIRLELSTDPHAVVLTIRDDGVGLPATPARAGGMGLRIMKYRAAVSGGTLRIEPAAPRGTAVTCTVPVPAGAG